MKLLIQRVKEASVTVNKKHISTINEGLLILVGIHHNDTEDQIKKCVKKAIELRIFNDHTQQMNLSCKDLQKDILVVSQFTLYGDCSKGRRPNYSLAAKLEKAKVLYDALLKEFEHQYKPVQSGQFAAMMDVASVNDGPVTILIEINND